ncbi:tRNA (guanine-N1)-methyltransferase [Winogradskyella endarachnes]|uniref:tRNA (Guanine-N1)-methyltransferase n=1 Tax=Winogradskyella endarachnes TaxID=2681965 RepID=A0A6L6U475_9FLAO|nr:tRNA (guanine-N1)-methyltransferase [Winogradskyella endarachnes]MUU76821.1 tRNA (guanine-N1)-methyltransferase [Winogradskyella endarachnes]
MKFLTKVSVILLVTLSFQSIKAQTETETEEKLSLNSGTIDNQFEYLIQKSGKYQDYKVVKRTWLYTLKAHVADTLKAVHKDLSDTQAVVKKQADEIESLKSNLENTKSALNATNDEKDNISLFGVQTSKASYKVLMWSIIGAITILLLFFIYKFKNSNSLTKQAKFKLEEVETEYEEHRRTALEREQKVRRQLQDEINKQKS